jgi:transmembrane sensor
VKIEEKMTDELLIRYITGQATTEESSQVFDWANQSEENQQELVRMKNAWVLAGLDRETDQGKKENEIQKIFDQIWVQLQKPQFIRTITMWCKIAAILLIAILSGVFGYFVSRPKTVAETFTEVFVPRGERSTVTLPDGTLVHLNGDSKIKFPSAFSTKTRNVEIEGEGFFEVVHNSEKPFIVSALGVNIEVLGTRFNVNCYPNEPIIQTYLESGRVKVTIPNSKYGNIILKPSEALNYNRSSKCCQKIIYCDKRLMDWTRGILTVQGETIEELAKKLERRFDIQIQFNDNEVKGHTYTGSIRDEELSNVLGALQFTSSLRYERRGNIVILSSNKH